MKPTIDINESNFEIEWYGIRCLPTILYFSDGEVRIGIFGTTNKEAILSQLRPVIASQPEPGFASFGKD